jgi:uracil-DNA glycosylase
VADRQALLDAIAEEIRAHGTCGFDVCDQAANMVPGEGSATADVVVVGEAPGASEDAQGRPFVGRAGKLLDELLAEAGLAREEVFITNVLKARPPRNRDPRADEVAHHLPWLQAQLEIIRPRLIVPVGRHALKRFAPRAAIGEVHGRVLQADGRSLFPMYHPAAAMHNQRLLPTLIADARALREILERPEADRHHQDAGPDAPRR